MRGGPVAGLGGGPRAVPLTSLIDAFDTRLAGCVSQSELALLLEGGLPEPGFDYSALLRHASLASRGGPLIRLDNYPPGWAAELAASAVAVDDPVHLACGRTSLGFPWERLDGLIALTRRHREI